MKYMWGWKISPCRSSNWQALFGNRQLQFDGKLYFQLSGVQVWSHLALFGELNLVISVGIHLFMPKFWGKPTRKKLHTSPSVWVLVIFSASVWDCFPKERFCGLCIILVARCMALIVCFSCEACLSVILLSTDWCMTLLSPVIVVHLAAVWGQGLSVGWVWGGHLG